MPQTEQLYLCICCNAACGDCQFNQNKKKFKIQIQNKKLKKFKKKIEIISKGRSCSLFVILNLRERHLDLD